MPPASSLPTRILDAALALHAREGLDALSLRRVARDVNVTPMAIYRHFRDKDALVDAMVAVGFSRWEEYLAAAARARTPRARLERGLLAYADFALAEPKMYELMFLTARPRIPDTMQALAASPSPSFSVMIRSVHEAMEAGELARGHPAEIILLFMATAVGMIAMFFTGRFSGDERAFRALYAKTIRRLLRALASS